MRLARRLRQLFLRPMRRALQRGACRVGLGADKAGHRFAQAGDIRPQGGQVGGQVRSDKSFALFDIGVSLDLSVRAAKIRAIRRVGSLA